MVCTNGRFTCHSHRLWYKYLDRVIVRPLPSSPSAVLVQVGWVPSGNTIMLRLLGIRSYLTRNLSSGLCIIVQHGVSRCSVGLLGNVSLDSLSTRSTTTLWRTTPSVPPANAILSTTQRALQLMRINENDTGGFSVSLYMNWTYVWFSTSTKVAQFFSMAYNTAAACRLWMHWKRPLWFAWWRCLGNGLS